MVQINQHDIEKARARYETEREKRWRPDGMSQYTDIENADAVNEHICPQISGDVNILQKCRVLIVGAGFGGLLFAVRLLQSGFLLANKILLVDTAGGFGGTWWWNSYPGLTCDVESYTYMPLLEETNYMPSQKYVSGLELKEHAQRIATKWKLSERGLFEANVEELTWGDREGQWTTRITRTDGASRYIKSEFVIMATGLLHSPKIPKLHGLEQFQGKVFHTSRWDYDYTGGTQKNPAMDRLQDKTIGFVGTGASAVQAIPHLAQWARKLVVFQRTPSAVDSRNNCQTDPGWWKEYTESGELGWQRRRMENFNAFLSNDSPLPEVNMVADRWTEMPSFSVLIGGSHALEPEYLTRMNEKDIYRQESIRRRIVDTVTDRDTASKLQPWYDGWCKRPCFSDDFLETFNRSNVTLVDTNGKGINDLTEAGIVVGEQEFGLDAIILGTGYSLGGSADRGSISITGRNNITFQQKCQSGLTTLHGVCTNGFPNLFFPGPYQAGATANQVYVLDQLALHVAHIISEAGKLKTAELKRQNAMFTVEPSVEMENQWKSKVLSKAWALRGTLNCTPGYFNREGLKMSEDQAYLAAHFSIWGEGISSFIKEIEGWRNEGRLDGLEIWSR
ncbi:unnamed protein product [Penicillium salamii]|uniref:FAD/NAD(P)-binding domain-containing protein n=1 Tax=Penicillium salamii TaxID=1612424 RepID=A0A9W4JVR7_9EURO|nr:unnamed protein product [Penicillium salamii]CAG7962385.1 unnamed protein product [Penicillium salamii]CAG8057017.1 unnamed protein product [Penicillium salamii]CAG8069525.1 unnamed protein product [Penicillium salamii]CAG8153820.1 unnamed protein product [Penicillium salamii]